MKLTGQGNAGQFGGPSGDLYVLIDIQSHSFFRRDGFDIHTVLPVKFSDAVLGGVFEMPTLHGHTLTGTEHGCGAQGTYLLPCFS